jgi:hypothetical protein
MKVRALTRTTAARLDLLFERDRLDTTVLEQRRDLVRTS